MIGMRPHGNGFIRQSEQAKERQFLTTVLLERRTRKWRIG